MKNHTFISSKRFPLLFTVFSLSACGKEIINPTNPVINDQTIFNVDPNEPVVVIYDSFQTNTSHGPQVLKNFYGKFGNDHKDVIVIARDVDNGYWDRDENNNLIYITTIVDEFKDMVEKFNPDIVNVSWGYSSVVGYPLLNISENSKYNYDTVEFDTMQIMLRDLWEQGVTITASAGNDYHNNGASITFASSIFPIVVGAYNQQDMKIYDWSNKGPAVVDFYEMGDGWNIQGTSFAAPRVAAHIALIRSEYPDISQSSIRTILEKNSIYDYEFGQYVQKLKTISNFDPSIDTRVKVEAVYEIFNGRNPDQEELDFWIYQIDNNQYNIFQLAEQLAADGVQQLEVAPIERMAAFWHFWLSREADDSEILEMLDDINNTSDWNITFDNFIVKENINTEYSFVDNNYNVLYSEIVLI